MGFKRSMKRMQQIETAAARRHGRATASPATAADQIVQSITSFALYGFPESHAASFALIVYASAYLKAHYPGGVLYRAPQQPADGVLPSGDAGQGRAAPRRPLRADRRADLATGRASSQDDGSVRLGLMYVKGLREEAGRMDSRHGHRRALRRRALEVGLERVAPCRCPAPEPDRSVSFYRRSRRAAVAASGGSADARRDRRARVVRRRSPDGALAGRAAGRPAGPLLMTSTTMRTRPGPTAQGTSSARVARDVRVQAGCLIEPLAPDVAARSRPRRLRRDGADDWPASDGARARVAGDPRRAARDRSARADAPGRRVRVAGAVITRQRPGHRQGICLPLARRRDRHREHHRQPRRVRRATSGRSSTSRICSSKGGCRIRTARCRSKPIASTRSRHRPAARLA